MTPRRPSPAHPDAVDPGVVDPGVVDPTLLRQTLGRFVSGVTVITTADDGPGDPQVHGMTANAFTSVSLRPPLVLVSVATRARLDPRIADNGRFGVSILAHDQGLLARHFAGSLARPDLVTFVWRDGLPLIAGALSQLTCSVAASHLAGDHRLYVGRVNTMWYRDGEPLVFYTGSLRSGFQSVAGSSQPEFAEDALGF